MRSFNSIEAFGSFLRALAPSVDTAAVYALHDGARAVGENARARLGHYDGNDWPQLADKTQEERKKLGYAPNDPLLRTGELRAAITVETHFREAVVGVPDEMVGAGSKADPVRNIGEIATDQELGTSRIPPRPFLAPAGAAMASVVAGGIAHAAADAFCGKRYTYNQAHGTDNSIPF